MESIVFNEDCIAVMKRYSDKYFKLAVVDPPYAVGASDGTFGNKGIYTQRGKQLKHYANHDEVPNKEYFDELFRVSENQIIWGSNYYPQYLYHSGAIIWDKKLTGSPMSDCEIAFQSFNKLVKKIELEWNGFLKGSESNSKRIHPNQKPVNLYKWIFESYLPEGGNVIDTHLGSGSSRIAAYKTNNINFTGCELHQDYYLSQEKRFSEFKSQLVLW